MLAGAWRTVGARGFRSRSSRTGARIDHRGADCRCGVDPAVPPNVLPCTRQFDHADALAHRLPARVVKPTFSMGRRESPYGANVQVSSEGNPYLSRGRPTTNTQLEAADGRDFENRNVGDAPGTKLHERFKLIVRIKRNV